MLKRSTGKFSPSGGEKLPKPHSEHFSMLIDSNYPQEDDSSAQPCSTDQKYAILPQETQKLQSSHLYEDEDDTQTTRVKPSGWGCCQKYSNSLKVLFPFRLPRKDKDKLPSNKAGLFSFFSLTWLTKLMWKAYKSGLQPEDLWNLQDEDCSEPSCSRIHCLWTEERNESSRKDHEPKLWKAIWKSASTRILVTIVISLFVNILQFLGPSVLLKLTLDYVNDPAVDYVYGTIIILIVLAVNLLRGALFNFVFVIGTHTATRITGGIQSLVYRKILKLKTGGEKLSAQMTNILTNDMERLFEAVISSVFLTTTPVFFTLGAVYGVIVIGPWSLAGMGCYFLFFPVMAGIAKAQSRVRVTTVKNTDKRVSLMSEILNSLALIKMYAWEESFSTKIAAIRKEELKKHRIGAFLQAVSSTIIPSIGILATICTLLGYTLAGLPLKSSEAFTIFSVFNAMQFMVGVLPFTIRSIAEAKVSLSRIQKLLCLPEHTKQVGGLVNNNLAIYIKSATFAWEVHTIDLKGSSQTSANEINKLQKEAKVLESSSPRATNESALKDSKNGNGNRIVRTPSVCSSPIGPSGKEISTGNSCRTSSSVRRTLSNHDSAEISEMLFGINLSVERGKLIGVCGSVGAGKSSLVAAVCGDMTLCTGQLRVNGRLALVTQQSWIYNATLRENILVGQCYEETRYQNVIEACCLQFDLDQLPSGDLTEIGERGVNLSGGQKQRVNLARAVYSNRDIYLLDDPLSAVDTKVAKHLFNRCIKELLAEKTVLLVSHGAHFLEKCDEVVLMSGGRICERGTHWDLMERRGEYFEMMRGFSTQNNQESSPLDPNEEQTLFRQTKKSKMETVNIQMRANDSKLEGGEAGKFIKEETKEAGGVGANVYFTFIRVCGGWGVCFVLNLAILFCTLSRIFNVVWLEKWLDAGDGLEPLRKENETIYNVTYSDDQLKGYVSRNENLWLYQLVYGLSFVALIITGIAKVIGVTFSVLAGSSRLHLDMFNSILRCPMKFLECTPAGRILNRFSRDMDEVDVRIPFFLEFVLQGMMSVFGQIVMICVFFPIFVIPLFFIGGLFVWIDVFLNAGVRELKRLDNNLKSPVIQHMTVSMTGLSVIRTFDRENIFIKRFNFFLDKHSAALLVFRLSNRWFTYRMDFIATLVTFAITVICVFTKGQFSTAVAGLALSTIYGVCAFIPHLMRMKSEFQARLTSVERIIEYAYTLESEAPRDIEETKPSPSWPHAGAIEMYSVNLRYRPDLPLVIRGITASIKPSEKIGIVGRTGAGKSSLITAILRIVELDSGWIKIDDVDISVIGLHALRSAISVIPQDPVLFKGSIRYNLDPFSEHNDDEVWTALERAHLKKAILKLSLKLYSEVEAAGSNFSVGEKQLICLARALLRNSKILLLDEATASVDIETDHLIQETIKEAFTNCTVLTIAHRLDTIATYDRVIVLHKGEVKEFESPKVLMTMEGSIFREMMVAMNVHTLLKHP